MGEVPLTIESSPSRVGTVCYESEVLDFEQCSNLLLQLLEMEIFYILIKAGGAFDFSVKVLRNELTENYKTVLI